MNIGLSIRKIRKQRAPQLNQSEFARFVGITQTYLSQIENGKKTPTIRVLENIANKFEIPLPIIFWYGIEISDVPEEKRGYFEFYKPSIDRIIDAIA